MMTEKQNLRYELLKAANYDVTLAEKYYEFVGYAHNRERAEITTPDTIPDGVYLELDNGREYAQFNGVALKQSIETCTGVAVKEGKKALVISLRDIVAPLTRSKGGTRFTEDFHQAIQDWDGAANTEDIRQILHDDIKLADDEYIPALGQLNFMMLHFTKINEALAAVGGEPLAETWYWSSTQSSATSAWHLNLNYGNANNWTTKAANQGRVRPVSAFLPLNN